MPSHRIGLIVPSSNTTMETEIPAMLLRRQQLMPEDRFTFHSSRMRMMHVTPEELRAMNGQAIRCAAELADARVDAVAYACLVAIMAQGAGYHCTSQQDIGTEMQNVAGRDIPVITSAGALIEALKHLGARRISIVTPYMKPLTRMVADYIEAEGIEVIDALSLEVSDNLAVGRLPQDALVDHARRVDSKGADALVLSACVQMPSLNAIPLVQEQFDIPVLSAAVSTVWKLLTELGLDPVVPGAGRLLARELVAS
ncbi:MAG: Asp/Glu racemase [Sphingomonadales bacterium]|nr:MAG: Asp/Glu racemase [Sphingomonadales bacterium]TNF05620.1 MAG: Asp/Glu racemase [Sphingomonadales bacterium]